MLTEIYIEALLVDEEPNTTESIAKLYRWLNLPLRKSALELRYPFRKMSDAISYGFFSRYSVYRHRGSFRAFAPLLQVRLPNLRR